jgi:hypothetical protein
LLLASIIERLQVPKMTKHLALALLLVATMAEAGGDVYTCHFPDSLGEWVFIRDDGVGGSNPLTPTKYSAINENRGLSPIHFLY